MSTNPSAPHDPRNCRHCAPFRHPSGARARRQLAAIIPPRTPMDTKEGK
ncbi:hypothetical protein [Streptomyces sp. NPDC057250]